MQSWLHLKIPTNSKNTDLTDDTSKECLDRFYQSHAGRPGIAVLAFLVQDVDIIRKRYQEKHPNLLVGDWDYPEDQVKILEVYAYYDKGDDDDNDDSSDGNKTHRNADKGTVLRFVQDNRQGASEDAGTICPVPGLIPCDAKYDAYTQPAYCDHWVSNGKFFMGLHLIFERMTSSAFVIALFLTNCSLSFRDPLAVFHRREFLDTLEDTLDFSPKVRLSCP